MLRNGMCALHTSHQLDKQSQSGRPGDFIIGLHIVVVPSHQLMFFIILTETSKKFF